MIIIKLKTFINRFTGHVYKIIPLKEYETIDAEEGIHLSEYIDSVAIEAKGALTTFDKLADNMDFVTVVNILNYLNENEVSEEVCKREVFKALNLLNRIGGGRRA